MSATARRWDAVVVGAGPAGTCTAMLLARAGHSVLLLDRARFPRDKPCSEYLSPAATRILDALGASVLGRIERATHARLSGMKIVAPGGAAAVGRFAASQGYPGLALPRTVLDTILRDAAEAAGAVVCERITVEALIFANGAVGGVVGRTGNGKRETYAARVVVGADGLRSVVARRLGLRRASRPRRLAFAAHVANVAGVGDLGEMHVGRDGYVGLGPIGGGVTTVALVVPQRLVRERRADPRAGFFAELDRFPGLRGRFDPGALVREVLVTGPFAQWSRTAVAPGGGGLLVGDAADFFDPFTGQGIYGALRGAELAFETLATALAERAAGPVPRRALAPYGRARGRAFAGKWVLERLIGLGVGWPALADRVIERLARRPALADLLVGAAGNVVPARAVLAPRTLARLLL